jgi:dipeptidyl aminopeptidase/acylaminoacyl peptidase
MMMTGLARKIHHAAAARAGCAVTPQPKFITFLVGVTLLCLSGCTGPIDRRNPLSAQAMERQITHGHKGRILTNTGVWSPDGKWIVYDTRSDAAGTVFDGDTIEMVNVRTGEVREVYRSKNGASCGVATFNPRENKVVFILGPENPTLDWQYNFYHRQGVIVDGSHPGVAVNLDACDLTPPFSPGALRGGSHVHIWDGAGDWVSFTYEDAILAQFTAASATNDINQRNIGVSIPGKPVRVAKDHPRNFDGNYFTVLVTRTTAQPQPGSDQIQRACEEGWVGTNGYVRTDGKPQRHALAFQGTVIAPNGDAVTEVFIADLPDDLTQAGAGPMGGTETRAPFPPRGVAQRRLTYTTDHKFPGIQGVRHWLRTSPDGTRIAFLMKDDAGIVQLWTVSPNGGAPRQLTRNAHDVASTFTWSPDGQRITHVMDNSVCITDAVTSRTTRLTTRSDDATAPRPEACVFSPDGKQIAFVRRVTADGQTCNQICVVTAP